MNQSKYNNSSIMSSENIHEMESPYDKTTLIMFCDGSAVYNGKTNCKAGYACIFPNHRHLNISNILENTEMAPTSQTEQAVKENQTELENLLKK